MAAHLRNAGAWPESRRIKTCRPVQHPLRRRHRMLVWVAGRLQRSSIRILANSGIGPSTDAGFSRLAPRETCATPVLKSVGLATFALRDHLSGYRRPRLRSTNALLQFERFGFPRDRRMAILAMVFGHQRYENQIGFR